MSEILNQVSDKEIAKEYKKRFFLQAGDKLSGSDDPIIYGINWLTFFTTLYSKLSNSL